MNPTDPHQGQGRPLSALLAAFCAVIAGALIGGAIFDGGAGAASGVALSFEQSIASVQLKVVNLALLAPGTNYSQICWRLGKQRAGGDLWCAERRTSTGPWRLTGENRKGARIRVDAASALLSIDPAAAHVAPGRYRWSFSVSACASVPAGTTGPTAADQCQYTFPKSGAKHIRIRSLIPAGCVVHGARQVYHGPRSRRIALTFDDGPAPLTPHFLRTLNRLHVHATFFLLGTQVPGHGGLLSQMLRDGHELANHSFDHAGLGGGGSSATAKIVRTNRAIERASGFRPCLVRPPYGLTGGDLVRRIRALRMTSVLWNVDPEDWRLPGAESITRTIRAQTRGGSIILEHDGGGPRGQTLAAIPHYVRALRARGYRFVTVSELLGYKSRMRLDK